jgi:Flp pilus assembly pilin Flp
MLKDTCRRAANRLGRRISRLGQKLSQDEDGQDLIEYALLTSIIAIAGILVFPTIQSKMADAYQDWNDTANDIWIPPPPM